MEIRELTCEEVLQLLDPFIDDELLPADKATVQSHLTSCATCLQELQNLEMLRAKLKQVPRYSVPPTLLNSVSEQLLREADHSPTSSLRHLAMRAAVSHLAAMIVGGLLVYGISLMWDDSGLRDQIVTAHVRSLMNGGLVQVSSEDPHTIKPWFASKVDFAPPVHDAKKEGFLLNGGRVDYLQGRMAAVLVYRYRKHQINVFVFSDTDQWRIVGGRSVQSGFNLINWHRNGFSFWAVSDLNVDELNSLSTFLAGR